MQLQNTALHSFKLIGLSVWIAAFLNTYIIIPLYKAL